MTYSPDSLVCTRNGCYSAELENGKKKIRKYLISPIFYRTICTVISTLLDTHRLLKVHALLPHWSVLFSN